jgi:hypothetical protein
MNRAPTKEQVKTLANSEPLLADAILRLADSAKKLLNSGLTDKALWVLLSHLSGESQSTCKTVIEAAANFGSLVKKR